MIDKTRFNDDDDERQPTVVGSGKFRVLTETDAKLARAAQALQQIVDMESCLLAHAQQIARQALEDIYGH